MGQHGPAPKRSSERRRRNKDSKPEKVTAQGPVVMPTASEDWHPIAQRWYQALSESGQSQFYEPSDWEAAYYVAEVLSRHLNQDRLSAELFKSLWAAMTDLLTTESSRRRVRMEVERTAELEDVTGLEEYRQRVGG